MRRIQQRQTCMLSQVLAQMFDLVFNTVAINLILPCSRAVSTFTRGVQKTPRNLS